MFRMKNNNLVFELAENVFKKLIWTGRLQKLVEISKHPAFQILPRRTHKATSYRDQADIMCQ